MTNAFATFYTLNYTIDIGPPDLGADADVIYQYRYNGGRMELVKVDVAGETRPYHKWTGPWSVEQDAENLFYNGDDDLHDALWENTKRKE